jgi:hypothetical protein
MHFVIPNIYQDNPNKSKKYYFPNHVIRDYNPQVLQCLLFKSANNFEPRITQWKDAWTRLVLKNMLLNQIAITASFQKISQDYEIDL